MTVQTAYNLLKSLKIPVAYGVFEKSCQLPYVTISAVSSTFSGSDDGARLVETLRLEVCLYTDKKDTKLEEEILKIFSCENEISRGERYIFEEKVFENTFYISTTNKMKF